MVISKIEMWVMNPKVSRAAHELLLAVAINCTSYTQMDADVKCLNLPKIPTVLTFFSRFPGDLAVLQAALQEQAQHESVPAVREGARGRAPREPARIGQARKDFFLFLAFTIG